MRVTRRVARMGESSLTFPQACCNRLTSSSPSAGSLLNSDCAFSNASCCSCRSGASRRSRTCSQSTVECNGSTRPHWSRLSSMPAIRFWQPGRLVARNSKRARNASEMGPPSPRRASVRRAAKSYSGCGLSVGLSEPPNCESSGVSCAMVRHTASMVRMLSRCGCCSRCQPRRASLARAERARTVMASSSAEGGFSSAFCKAFSTRSRISAVAFSVKVMARISSGSSTSASSLSSRRVNSSVLPEPAGACTRNDCCVSSVRARSVWSTGDVCPGLLKVLFLRAASRCKGKPLLSYLSSIRCGPNGQPVGHYRASRVTDGE